MKEMLVFRFALYMVGAMMALSLVGCYGSGGGSKNSRAQISSIASPEGLGNQAAASKNNEGVDHLVQGHYEIALKHFRKAIASKPDFAEAHFNLAVTLDGLGRHADATASFKKAKQFGGNNQKIVESTILMEHLNL